MYRISDRVPLDHLKGLRSVEPTNRTEYLDLLEIHYNLKIVPDFPLKVTLELSSYCNLKCVMCPRTYMDRKPNHMDAGLAHRLIDECYDNGVYYMAFQRHGESLLHPQAFEIIGYSVKVGIPVTCLITNGLLLDEEKAVALLSTGLSTVIISLDGVSAKMYEHLRKADKFEQLKGIVKLLWQIRERLGLDTFLQVNTLVTDEASPDECKAFEEEMRSYVDYVHVSQSIPYVPPQIESAMPGIFVPGLPVNEVPCPQIWRHLVVLANGNVTMCCIDPEGGLLVGNAKKQTLSEIWHGLKADHIRAKHIKGDMSGLTPCSTCPGDHPMSYSVRSLEGNVEGTLLEQVPLELV